LKNTIKFREKTLKGSLKIYICIFYFDLFAKRKN